MPNQETRSNSLQYVLGYVKAMFRDIAPMYSKPSEVERDLSRLLHEVSQHGVEVLGVDLPAQCKHFDRCLALGLYEPSGLPYQRSASRSVVVPALLQDLYLQVFEPTGMLKELPCVNAILAIRQALKGLSKVKLQCNKERIVHEVLNFQDIEESLPKPSLSWERTWDDIDELARHCRSLHLTQFNEPEFEGFFKDCDVYGSSYRPIGRGEPTEDFAVMQIVCDTITTSLGDFFCEKEYTHEGEYLFPQHGKGRVSNLSKRESKFTFLEWPSKLDRVFPFDLYGVPDLGVHSRAITGMPGDCKSPSKLIAVPKTLKGPRLIASEPNQMQFIQQLVRHQVHEAYRRNKFLRKALTLEDQSGNAKLALSSSHTGSHATIDLSSASDRLSLRLLERVLRGNPTLLMRIHACRSESIRNGISSDWDVIHLRKAFSQGNALTFPIQSLVYSCICATGVILARGMAPTSRNIQSVLSEVKVYGDDLIVPTDSFERTVNLLEGVALKVNLDKTFSKGKFRESCGIDAYDGVNITPSYVKNITQSPRHEHAVSTIEASNNLHLNGWWHLANWQGSLVGSLHKDLPIIGALDDNDLSKYKGKSKDKSIYEERPLSFVSYTGVTISHLKKRYNPDLQRDEYQTLNLISNSKKQPHRWDFQHLYQWMVEKPSLERTWSSGYLAESSAVLRRGWSGLNLVFDTITG